MKSSNRSIPIALEAEPTKTGASRAFVKPSFAPCVMTASGSVPSSRYCSIRASSDSATASISFSRAGSAIAWISSGHSDSSALGPDGYRSAFSWSRSAMPLKSFSAPIGSSNGATWFPKEDTSWSSVAWKSARSRSSLFTKIARGRSSWTASSHANSVWTSTPSTAETTTITASAARTAERTSPTKSAVPGASRTLIFASFHSIGDIARDTEIWRRCSSGSWSETVLPSSTVPIRVMAPEANSIASSRVVFPEPPCPTSKTLRMSFAS